MAEKTLGEINVQELELIESIRTAVKAFENRNPSVVVDAVVYDYTAGGTIKYNVTLRSLTSNAVTPTSPVK